MVAATDLSFFSPFFFFFFFGVDVEADAERGAGTDKPASFIACSSWATRACSTTHARQYVNILKPTGGAPGRLSSWVRSALEEYLIEVTASSSRAFCRALEPHCRVEHPHIGTYLDAQKLPDIMGHGKEQNEKCENRRNFAVTILVERWSLHPDFSGSQRLFTVRVERK